MRHSFRPAATGRAALAAALVLGLAGCSAVYSPQPVGETPLVLAPPEWEGTWLHGDGAVSVAVVDADAGVLEVGWVERGQDRLELESYRVRLAKSGRWLFGSAEDADRPGLFVWAAVARDGDQLTLWIPRPARVAELVGQGVLRGRALQEGGDDVVLEPTGAAELERVMAPADGAIDWERPLVFIRIAR